MTRPLQFGPLQIRVLMTHTYPPHRQATPVGADPSDRIWWSAKLRETAQTAPMEAVSKSSGSVTVAAQLCPRRELTLSCEDDHFGVSPVGCWGGRASRGPGACPSRALR